MTEQLTLLSTIIGLIGGLLGVYVFFDNYVFRFKPSIKIANTIYILIPEKKSETNKEFVNYGSIICSFDIFNHRNKIGRIDDFLVRVYNSDHIQPRVFNLFPRYELSRLPNCLSEVSEVPRTPYTPISILNKSNKSITIEFSVEKYHAFDPDPQRNVQLEVFYKNNLGKWKKFGEFNLNSLTEESEKFGKFDIHSVSIIELLIDRANFAKKITGTRITIYKGISEFYIGNWLRTPYYRFLSSMSNLYSCYRLLIDTIVMSMRYIYSEFILSKLLTIVGKYVRQPSWSTGNKDASEITDKALLDIKKILEIKIQTINLEAKGKAIISLKKVDHALILSRNKGEIRIYKSGDGYITIQNKIETIFSLNLKKYVFGFSFWKVNRKSVLHLKTICTNVLDYLILNSDH